MAFVDLHEEVVAMFEQLTVLGAPGDLLSRYDEAPALKLSMRKLATSPTPEDLRLNGPARKSRRDSMIAWRAIPENREKERKKERLRSRSRARMRKKARRKAKQARIMARRQAWLAERREKRKRRLAAARRVADVTG